MDLDPCEAYWLNTNTEKVKLVITLPAVEVWVSGRTWQARISTLGKACALGDDGALLSVVISFSSVELSHSVVSDSLWPHEPQHSRPPCLLPTPGIYPPIRVHWVGDAIQPSLSPLSSPSPPALSLSQHQGLFQWVSSLRQVAKLLEFQLKYQSWIFRTDFL